MLRSLVGLPKRSICISTIFREPLHLTGFALAMLILHILSI